MIDHDAYRAAEHQRRNQERAARLLAQEPNANQTRTASLARTFDLLRAEREVRQHREGDAS